MTLVLPYCSDNIENRLLFEPLGSMPCVYDGEPLDFESALMSGEWPALKDIATEYEQNEDSTKATSGSGEKNSSKRKLPSEICPEDEQGATEAKKPCSENFLTSPFAEISCGASSSPSNSLDCSHSEPSVDDDEEPYLPRRRGPQMWNSRQRWKDERKKVLKMSVGKLTEIEDPELWLLRSVLINNTIKRLHQDIRNERQAKVRHRQQKMDFYQERYEPPTASSSANAYDDKKTAPAPSDIYDDTSCDEIFGISEDFLRVNIPDRRLSSSPIPTNPVHDAGQTDKDSAMDVDPSCHCDTSSNHPQQPQHHHHHPQQQQQQHSSPIAFTTRGQTTTGLGSTSTRHIGGGSSQCATQFRTNDASCGCGTSDSTFPPRVPILDSVVYHSLLASLESS